MCSRQEILKLIPYLSLNIVPIRTTSENAKHVKSLHLVSCKYLFPLNTTTDSSAWKLYDFAASFPQFRKQKPVCDRKNICSATTYETQNSVPL